MLYDIYNGKQAAIKCENVEKCKDSFTQQLGK